MTDGQTQKITLDLVSDEAGFLGPRLHTSIEALPAGDGRYLVTLNEWNATLGPVFDRSVDRLNADPKDRSFMATAFGYEAMDAMEKESYHSLVQAFRAADALKAGQDVFDAYLARYRTADMKLNSYGLQLKEFAETLVNDGQVLISRQQLQGLANMARHGMAYVTESQVNPESARFFDTHVGHNPRVDYSRGLLSLIL